MKKPTTLGLMAAIAVAASALFGAETASATTDTFNYTGGAQTWTVPAGVTQATFDLYGAQGAGPGAGFLPGLGGRATATIPVTSGASIQVNVGGQGGHPTGGFNGGGDGGITGTVASGFGGGGASDIRIGGMGLADRVLVAGGGGGAGGSRCLASVNGGGGGGESGEPGLASTNGTCAGSVAGGGGKQDAGGTATSPATAGVFGDGGDGGVLTGVGGGGGGGGWFGGGGGLASAGGGGGSGHGPTGTAFETGVRSGDGLVTVTYTVATIADLIDSVRALDLHHGIERSLLKKLTGAQRSLDAGHTHGTCGKLAAFIHQVKAQSGKKIDADDATGLIDEANAVRDSVGCT